MIVGIVQEIGIASGIAAIAVMVFLVGARLRPATWQQTGEEAAGTPVLDLSKTFFTAVVAFMVVLCWQQYDAARRTTTSEANALLDVYWIAHEMPDPEHHRIQELLHDYTVGIVETEWPVMNHERQLSQRTQKTFDTLRDAVESAHPADPYASNLRASALTGLAQAAKARQDRAVATRQGIPPFLYALLYFSATMMLLSPVLSGVRVGRRSIMMITLLGVVVGAAIVVIHNLDHPFSGNYTVPKDAFESAVSRYANIS